MESVDGRVAVITGGGSGIGRATALSLARRGAHVLVSDIDEGRAAAVAEEVKAIGTRGIGVRCDVADLAQVEALQAACQREFGRVDIVMSNVGVLATGLPLAIPLEEWQRVIDINLLGTARVVTTFLPTLESQGSGHLVTTASTAGLFPYAYDRLPYAASKGAVIAMTEALALYLRPLGIGVTCLCPAGVMTNILEQVRQWGPRAPMQTPQIPIVEADYVGELVVEAILSDRLIVLTDPKAHAMLREHADDPDAFLARQLALLAEAKEAQP